MKSKTNFSILTEEEKKKILDKIIAFYLDERGEEIGLVAATTIFDFMGEEILPIVYNKGIEDAKAALKENLAELEFKLMELKKDEP